MRGRWVVVLLLFQVLMGWTQEVSLTATDQGRALVKTLMETQNIPGLSVSVSQNGKLLWSEGFGYADLEQKVPVFPDKTLFRIGSVSKSLTAVGLAHLVQSGALDLDLDVRRYVPSFPQKKDTFTLRQLAGHLAGIRHYRGDEFLSAHHYNTIEEGLAIFQNDTLLFKPGSHYAYSSYGWNLISAAMENAAHKDFLTYMDEDVFRQMGLRVYADRVSTIVPFRTRFYEPAADGNIVNAPFVDNSYKWAGGGFLMTSEELAHFGDLLLEHIYLDADTLDGFIAPQHTTSGENTHYGMGFSSGVDANGRQWFGHSGGSVGGITQFVVFPNEKLVVALVTNSSEVKYGKLPWTLADAFLANE